jgi:hypothetical protein
MSGPDRLTAIAAVVGVGLVAAIGGAAWWVTRTPTSLVGAKLKVHPAKTERAVPGDLDGALTGVTPTDTFTLDLRLCPGKDALPSSPPTALWTAPGTGAWRRATVAPVWSDDGECRFSVISVPVSDAWPGQSRGVGRWALVVGPGGDALPNNENPASEWRATGLLVDGEVVVLPTPK